MVRLRSALLALVLLAAVTGCRRDAPTAAAAPTATILTLLAVSEVRGTPEPCGCQSDPLGDVARVATLVAEAKSRGPALLIDGGGLRYGADPMRSAERAQAEQKAELLEQAWSDLEAVTALGDEDLRYGLEPLQKARRLGAIGPGLLPNVVPHTIRQLGGIKVGLFAVLDPAHGDCGGLCPNLVVEPPVEAARRAVAELRAAGARIVVALAHLQRGAARRLAQAVPGITIVVVGDDVLDGGETERLGETLVVHPAVQAQRVARIELHLDGGRVSTELFDGAEGRARELARLDKKLAEVAAQLAALAKAEGAEPAFVATQKRKQEELVALRAGLANRPLTPPAGAHAVVELVPVRQRLARAPALAAAMGKLDRAIGELNRQAGEKVPPPAAREGEASYVGIEECEDCHDEAVVEWRGTIHAQAWEHLVKVDKQWSFDCIGCHVTGYGQRGGSAVAHVKGLTDVQCEVCHGPGSRHAEAPKKHRLTMPVEGDCKICHTKDHSDTFAFAPYLRDVLGDNHGKKRRQALGPGPTGRELRRAAEQKAGKIH